MSRAEFRCIYSDISPKCAVSQQESKEHYLPRGLGRFRGVEPLRGRVCKPCNEELGRLHDVFLHTGVEGICRQIQGLSGRKKHREKNPYREPTHKLPPLDALGKLPGTDLDVLWESPSGGPDMQVMPQIILRDANGIHRIRITNKMWSDEGFREGLRSANLTEALPVKLMLPEEESGAFREVFTRYYGDSVRLVGGTPCASVGSIETSTTVTLSPEYHRAIAVIGFHFFLKRCPSLNGLEPEFTAVKDYLFNGGDYGRFLSRSFEPLLEQVGPFRCAHLFALKIVDNAINIVMIFFAGSVRNPLVWKLSIPAPQKVFRLHAEGWAHTYYSRDSNKTDADGELFMLKDPRCTVPPFLKLNLLSPWWPGRSIPVNLDTQEQIEALFQNRNKNRCG